MSMNSLTCWWCCWL